MTPPERRQAQGGARSLRRFRPKQLNCCLGGGVMAPPRSAVLQSFLHAGDRRLRTGQSEQALAPGAPAT